MSLPKIFREELYRGDKWARTVTFTKSGHTWSNQSVSAVIKTAIDGTIVHTLTPSVSVAGTVVTATLSIAGATTADFTTGELHMDVQISDDTVGPITPIKFLIDVKGDIS